MSSSADSADDGHNGQRFVQDPIRKSKRVWSAVSSILCVVLLLPEVQVLIQHYLTPRVGEAAPLVMAALSAVLAGASKRADKRPIKRA